MEPPNVAMPEYRAYLAAPSERRHEIDEYERLLAERFQRDPDMPQDPASIAESQAREARIHELYEHIFGSTLPRLPQR